MVEPFILSIGSDGSWTSRAALAEVGYWGRVVWELRSVVGGMGRDL